MKWIFSLMLLCNTLISIAQPDGEMDEKRKEKIETLKRLYISEKLELTTAEAEKFWPVYNAFAKQRDDVKKELHRAQKRMKEGIHTEKEAIETIDFVAQQKKKEADLDAQFFKDCMPSLGVEKVMKLSRLQKEFQQELVRRMKERQQERRPGGEGKRRY